MREFRNILIVCDDSSAHENAFERVRSLARDPQVAVTLVDVIDSAPGQLSQLLTGRAGESGAEVEAGVVEAHRERLEMMAEELREHQVQVDCAVLMGRPVVEILRKVVEDDHDLVIKGAQRSRARPLLSDPDIALSRRCTCPVWILNAPAEARARRILAAVDPDPTEPERHDLNWRILEFATALANEDDAWLDVLNAWRLPEESALRHGRAKVPEDVVEGLVDAERRRSNWRLQRLTADFAGSCKQMRVLHVGGYAPDVILDHVETDGIDTVVMGSIGRDGLPGLVLGNMSEKILKRVDCSVLTVKPRAVAPRLPAPGAELRAP